MTTRVVCKIFGHRRSVSCAQRVEGVWRSRCKRCGAKLVRVQRKWRETAKVDVLALRQQLLRHLDQRYAIIDHHGADLRSAFFKRGVELAPGELARGRAAEERDIDPDPQHSGVFYSRF